MPHLEGRAREGQKNDDVVIVAINVDSDFRQTFKEPSSPDYSKADSRHHQRGQRVTRRNPSTGQKIPEGTSHITSAGVNRFHCLMVVYCQWTERLSVDGLSGGIKEFQTEGSSTTASDTPELSE